MVKLLPYLGGGLAIGALCIGMIKCGESLAREDRALIAEKSNPSMAAVQRREAPPPPAPAVVDDGLPRTSNGKNRIDIESGCRGLILQKVDDIDWPGWKDEPLGQPVVTQHGAVWKGWFRARNAFGAKVRHTFACRYVAQTDMLSVRFDE